MKAASSAPRPSAAGRVGERGHSTTGAAGTRSPTKPNKRPPPPTSTSSKMPQRAESGAAPPEGRLTSAGGSPTRVRNAQGLAGGLSSEAQINSPRRLSMLSAASTSPSGDQQGSPKPALVKSHRSAADNAISSQPFASSPVRTRTRPPFSSSTAMQASASTPKSSVSHSTRPVSPRLAKTSPHSQRVSLSPGGPGFSSKLSSPNEPIRRRDPSTATFSAASKKGENFPKHQGRAQLQAQGSPSKQPDSNVRRGGQATSSIQAHYPPQQSVSGGSGINSVSARPLSALKSSAVVENTTSPSPRSEAANRLPSAADSCGSLLSASSDDEAQTKLSPANVLSASQSVLESQPSADCGTATSSAPVLSERSGEVKSTSMTPASAPSNAVAEGSVPSTQSSNSFISEPQLEEPRRTSGQQEQSLDAPASLTSFSTITPDAVKLLPHIQESHAKEELTPSTADSVLHEGQLLKSSSKRLGTTPTDINSALGVSSGLAKGHEADLAIDKRTRQEAAVISASSPSPLRSAGSGHLEAQEVKPLNAEPIRQLSLRDSINLVSKSKLSPSLSTLPEGPQSSTRGATRNATTAKERVSPESVNSLLASKVLMPSDVDPLKGAYASRTSESKSNSASPLPKGVRQPNDGGVRKVFRSPQPLSVGLSDTRVPIPADFNQRGHEILSFGRSELAQSIKSITGEIVSAISASSSSTLSTARPPAKVSIAEGALVSTSATLRGTVSIGKNTIVQPKCILDGFSAPLVIGEGNVLEERVLVTNQGDTELVIGNNNLFEAGSSLVTATAVGNCNIFEAGSFVGNGASLGSGCVVAAGCVLRGQAVANFTAVYGVNAACAPVTSVSGESNKILVETVRACVIPFLKKHHTFFNAT